VSNYIKTTDFAVKDSLLTGNPAKVIKGSEIDAEFAAVSTAFSTKVDITVAAGSASLPSGTTAQRDSVPSAGYTRYNSTTSVFEGYGSSWLEFVQRTAATGTAALPSGTTAQRSTALGVGVRYNTDLSQFEGYNGASWGSIGGGATGGGADTLFQLNNTTMTTSYTLPTGKNAMVVGPLTINTGVTLTVPSGQRLVVL